MAIRVYELSKKMGLSNKELIRAFERTGIFFLTEALHQ